MPGAAIFRTLAGILSAPVTLDVSSVRRALKTSASFNFRNVKCHTMQLIFYWCLMNNHCARLKVQRCNCSSVDAIEC